MAWTLLLLALLAFRLPSLREPIGGDQGIYGYDGQRVLAGDLLYRDAWDQKPPGIAYVYALGWRIWPHQSVVAVADLAAAGAVALFLVVIGRRRFTENVGFGAAALFLLFGDPYLQRASGIFVRGQCETFIALAAAGSLALLSSRRRRVLHLVLAGVGLAAAFWLKYNAIAYALPIGLAVWFWRDERTPRPVITDLAVIGLCAVVAVAAGVAYFAARGAFHDLWLATINYNLHYSEETYTHQSRLGYLFSFPVRRAGVEMLWYLGGLGVIALLWLARSSRAAVVLVSWVVAAVLSIVINGARDLPQYFIQANPALALAAAAGLGALLASPGLLRYAAATACALGLWRVGDEARLIRLGGLPEAIENQSADRIEYFIPDDYLRRFTNPQKYDALENYRLAEFIQATSSPSDPIYVFGFAGSSICWTTNRVSSSRFSWSRPVTIEFAADEPGYGSAGLLADLQRRPPSLVALQKDPQWHSAQFFMDTPPLRDWLERGYTLDHETPMFAVWVKKH